ncbi:SCO4848 family membrane protein [Actinoplanes sp. CA-030573]|uniref:SCO4848 family membrane protein n=1 Tax=Actinoplanes sp. CA-030573 TaxID=3239898 RepID=UPI003D8D35D6
MVLSRRWAVFLILVGVWTWLIWPRFGLAIYRDDRSFADGRPTSFLVVHALLIAASLVIGSAVGLLGIRGWRATRPRTEDSVGATPSRPQD